MNILIFGGTTEGGLLARILSKNGYAVTLSVATRYAEELSGSRKEYELVAGRLDESGLVRFLENRPFDIVVDATHPYADEATRNIRRACETTGTEYKRLLRSQGDRYSDVRYVENAGEAVAILDREPGNIFLAIGSKELKPFTRLEGFASRCFVRILPMPESLQKAIDLGFRNANLICMQGPFDAGLNKAMLEATDASFLVTKDSGEPGGFDGKLDAAFRCGCSVIVLDRPFEEGGDTFEELCEYFRIDPREERKTDCSNTFFPLFFDLKDKTILVVGGGKVAERRIGILRRFGVGIRLVSPAVTDNLREAADNNDISYVNRTFEPGDVERYGPFLTIAATDCRETNETVAAEAKRCGIPVVVSDCRDRCDCYFPAIAENGKFLAGIVSKDGDHRAVRIAARQVRCLFNEQ